MPLPESRKYNLKHLARACMVEHGLAPAPPQEALLQLSAMKPLERSDKDGLRDLTGLLWCSIDNDDSRDLDQLSVAEVLPDGATRLRVAVADVDVLVKRNTPLDLHARKNTTSVYTGIITFPMLPERLSTDWTSLNENEDRVALIIEMTVKPNGELGETRIDRAWVRNKAQLTYNAVSAWFEGKGPLPPKAAAIPGMDEQLRVQDAAAQHLRKARHDHGALDLETIQARPVTENDVVIDLVDERQNRAQELIEDLMVAANGVTTRFLESKGFATFRRVVRSPERWARIVEMASQFGGELPAEPDSKALNVFLLSQKAKDSLRFPDLCLTVVKLMGRGEYVMEEPGGEPIGHFGLAVRDYSHSTAPNRRYPDLITHRLLKAALNGNPQPYTPQELRSLADHCTEMENESEKVERQMRKSAAAVLLEPQIGRVFDAIVTGASDKGVWARIFRPPIEGKVIRGGLGLDVGDRCKVRLVEINVENGWIDFETAHGGKGVR